jgi:hypothetical protein
VKDARLLEGVISLECLLEPIVADAAAARESRAVRIDPVVAGNISRLRNVRARAEHRAQGEHWATGEREQRQSCDNGFHFRSPSFERKASVRRELAGTGENELTKHVSREAGLKELKSVPEMVLRASDRFLIIIERKLSSICFEVDSAGERAQMKLDPTLLAVRC